MLPICSRSFDFYFPSKLDILKWSVILIHWECISATLNGVIEDMRLVKFLYGWDSFHDIQIFIILFAGQ